MPVVPGPVRGVRTLLSQAAVLLEFLSPKGSAQARSRTQSPISAPQEGADQQPEATEGVPEAEEGPRNGRCYWRRRLTLSRLVGNGSRGRAGEHRRTSGGCRCEID
jgi:hypothetical protein